MKGPWKYEDAAPELSAICHICGQKKIVYGSKSTGKIRAVLCPTCDVLPITVMVRLASEP